MDVDVTNHYPAEVEPVLDLLADPSFITSRAEAIGHTKLEMLVAEGEGPGARVVHYRREVPVTVPSFAAKVLAPRVVVEQRDEWSAADPATGARTGTWRVRTKGLPIVMDGEMRLEAAEGGCAMHLSGSLHVGIPLIGRRLGTSLLADTLATIEAEREVAVAHLGRNR